MFSYPDYIIPEVLSGDCFLVEFKEDYKKGQFVYSITDTIKECLEITREDAEKCWDDMREVYKEFNDMITKIEFLNIEPREYQKLWDDEEYQNDCDTYIEKLKLERGMITKDCVTHKDLILIMMHINHENLVPFNKWLAKIGEEELVRIENKLKRKRIRKNKKTV